MGGYDQPELYRIWIARVTAWHPCQWYDVPPEAEAIEPAQPGCLDSEQARVFLQGFNDQMLATAGPLWAVALPVCGRFEGDPHAGELVSGHPFSAQAPAVPTPDENAGTPEVTER